MLVSRINTVIRASFNRYLTVYPLVLAALHRVVFGAHGFHKLIAQLVGLNILVYVLWKVILYPKVLSPLRHLPGPSDGDFFLGHFWRFFKEPAGEPQRDWIETIPNDGLIRYFWAFNRETILLTTPRALSEVMLTKNYDFVKPDNFRVGLGSILGIGILLAEGDEHKRQRKLLNPAFSFRHVKELYPLFWSKSVELINTMSKEIEKPQADTEKPSSVLEVGHWASRATLDIIGAAGLGSDFHSLERPDNELAETYNTIFGANKGRRVAQLIAVLLPMWLIRLLPLKRNQELSTAIRVIKRTCYELIYTKKEKLAKAQSPEADILSVALSSGGFTDDNLVNQLMTFLAAGHETTASALTWALYLLSKDPEKQARLRAEIRQHLPAPSTSSSSFSSSEPSITAAQIDSLPYLNAVVQETLRFFPPVPLTFRVAAKDTTIIDTFIPKGTTIVICPWAVNNSTKLWGPTASQFDPNRWLHKETVINNNNDAGDNDSTSPSTIRIRAESNFAYTTFLHGPRSCIGMGFAKAEFACLLAAWVGRFSFEIADPEYKLDIGGGITAKPKGGLPMRLTAVEGW